MASSIVVCSCYENLFVCDHLYQGFSTSGSPSDFRGVARLSTNLLKNDGIFKY